VLLVLSESLGFAIEERKFKQCVVIERSYMVQSSSAFFSLAVVESSKMVCVNFLGARTSSPASLAPPCEYASLVPPVNIMLAYLVLMMLERA
jgi:hypothetical protein